MRDPIVFDPTCDEVRDLAAPFVLGALDADEADAVRGHLASCAEPHLEFAELASVVPVLAASVDVFEPPASLKERLMAAAAADLEARRRVTSARQLVSPVAAAPVVAAPGAAAPVVPDVAPLAGPTPIGARPATRPVVVMPRRSSGTSFGGWAMRIAAVLAIAVLGGWNLLLQGQLQTARSYEENVAAVLDVAGQEGALTAVLTAEGAGGPTGLAAVSADGAVMLAMRDLPATSGDQVYEAWIIGSDGVPAALGGFKVGDAGTAFFTGDGQPTEPGAVLALTLEPAPGATQPTSPVISLGTATAAG